MTVQREPFLTSVWIIIASAVLISLPMAYYIYYAHFSPEKSVFDGFSLYQLWSDVLPDIVRLFTLPFTVIFAGFYHLRKGVNRVTALVFILGALCLLGLCLYVSHSAYEEMQLLYSDGNLDIDYFIKNSWAFAILGICYLLSGFGLRTSIAMLRYNPKAAITAETFD